MFVPVPGYRGGHLLLALVTWQRYLYWGLELSPAEHGATERLEAWHFCSGLDLAMPGCDTLSRTLNLYDGQNLIKKPHNLTLTFVFFIETTATVCVHSMCGLREH